MCFFLSMEIGSYILNTMPRGLILQLLSLHMQFFFILPCHNIISTEKYMKESHWKCILGILEMAVLRCRDGIVSWKFHDDVIKWKHFPRYWPFVRGIHRSPVNSPHKGQGHGALMFSLICAWINDWVNNRKAGDLRRHRAHYEVTVMLSLHRPLMEIGYIIFY